MYTKTPIWPIDGLSWHTEAPIASFALSVDGLDRAAEVLSSKKRDILTEYR